METIKADYLVNMLVFSLGSRLYLSHLSVSMGDISVSKWNNIPVCAELVLNEWFSVYSINPYLQICNSITEFILHRIKQNRT